MKLEDALDIICDEAKKQGAEQYDALAGESESLGLELFEGKVKNTEISNSRGIGIRLFKNGRPGYAFTERMTREAILQTVTDAISHTRLTDSVNIDLPEAKQLPSIDLNEYNTELEHIDLEKMKILGLEMEAIALKGDARVENVPYLGAGRSSGSGMIQNSKGVRYYSRHNSISAGIGVVSKEGEQKKMGVYSRGGRSFDIFDAKEMARLAVERSVELLGAKPLSSEELPIVFSNRCSSQIFGMFGSAFYAESVQKGQSRLVDKLNQSIAFEGLTIINDCHRPDLPGSRLFDSEGVLTLPFNVVENGVLHSYLYNLEAAKKEGREPTGNGSRGYSGHAGTAFSNFIVNKGSDSLEELLAKHPRCFLIVKLEGSSGCSSTSGEISIGAQGFLCEQGKIVSPVDRVTISGNFFDLIKKIEGFSDSYFDSFSSMKVPDFLVSSMYVSG